MKMLFLNRLIVYISLLLLFLTPTFSFAATFCVSNATELQTALTTAQSNGEDDTIQVVQGTYNGNFTYAATEANNLAIEGGYTSGCASRVVDPANTVLDGGGVDNVLALVIQTGAADFSVEGLTIQNGSASTVENGGGVYIKNNGATTLNRNIFSNNSSPGGYGGGLYNSGRGTLTDNTFTGNTAGGSGGGALGGSKHNLTNNIFSENTAYLNAGGCWFASDSTLTNNTFTGNTATTRNGGGAYVNKGTLIGNTFIGNKATSGAGGGAYASFNSTLKDNIFELNSASYGGGASLGNGCSVTDNLFSSNIATEGDGGGAYVNHSTLSNNSFIWNTAKRHGGGAFVWGGTLINNAFCTNNANTGAGIYSDYYNLSMINNTVSDNNASSQGGGIWVQLGENIYPGKLYNNIIWNNTAPVAADLYIDNTGDDQFFPVPVDLFNNDLDQSTSGMVIVKPFTIDPRNLNNTDPLFVSSGNYHLSASSPCINTGDNNAPDLPTTDKDGNPRIVNSTVDLGAYEYNPLVPTADAGQDQTVDIGTTVTLDGSNSSDPEGEALTYLWTQAGATVTLSDSTAVQPSFTAPERETSLLFQLTVANAGSLKNSDWVSVNVAPLLPSVTTNPVTAITSNSASSGGNVTSDGGGFVIAKGVCWSTSENPTISDPHSMDGANTGTFTGLIGGLNPATPYHVRAYATNSGGTGYGEDISFTTLPTIPTVTTAAVSNVTGNSAQSGGNVTSAEGSTVTARGVCWSSGGAPTLADSHTTDGDGTGAFISTLAGLSPGTTYQVRAYATNSVGTAYGTGVSFKTDYATNIYVSKIQGCGGKSPCFTDLQTAVSAAGNGSLILIAEGTYAGDFSLDGEKAITLQGGWDTSFENMNMGTKLQGAPRASKGSLTIQNATIEPK